MLNQPGVYFFSGYFSYVKSGYKSKEDAEDLLDQIANFLTLTGDNELKKTLYKNTEITLEKDSYVIRYKLYLPDKQQNEFSPEARIAAGLIALGFKEDISEIQ